MSIFNPSIFEYKLYGCTGESLEQLAKNIPRQAFSLLEKELGAQAKVGYVVGSLFLASKLAGSVFPFIDVSPEHVAQYHKLIYLTQCFNLLMVVPFYNAVLDPFFASGVLKKRKKEFVVEDTLEK